MTQTTIILTLGLVSALAFGIADFFGAKASKRLGPITSAFCVQAASTVMYLAYYALFVHRMPLMSGQALAYTITSSVLIVLGVCALYRAFEIGPVSLASPLSAAYPLIAAIVGLLFFHARLDGWQILGVALLVAGIMAVSGIFSVRASEWRLGKGQRLALWATLAWGIGYPLLGKAIEASGWREVACIQMLLMPVVIALILAAVRKQESVDIRLVATTLRSPLTVVAGITMVIAELAINVGYEHGQAAGTLIVAISSAYPAITILLALRHFKERISLWSALGVAATICGIAVLLLT